MAGTLIGAGASLIGGAISGGSASDAAAQQSASADKAVAEQRRQYDLNRQDLAPWRNSGSAALSKLDMLLGITPTADPSAAGKPSTSSASGATTTTTPNVAGAGGQMVFARGKNGATRTVIIPEGSEIAANTFYDMSGNLIGPGQTAHSSTTNTTTPSAPAVDPATQDPQYGSLLKDFTTQDFLAGQDPAYQFRMDEGQKAIERSAAARGGALSGRAVKEAERYGQDAASQEYGAAFNRYNTNRQTKYNFLSGQAGTGQEAVNTGVASGNNAANNISNLYTQQGNVNAAGTVASGNAFSQDLTGLGTAAFKNTSKINNFFNGL